MLSRLMLVWEVKRGTSLVKSSEANQLPQVMTPRIRYLTPPCQAAPDFGGTTSFLSPIKYAAIWQKAWALSSFCGEHRWGVFGCYFFRRRVGIM